MRLGHETWQLETWWKSPRMTLGISFLWHRLYSEDQVPLRVCSAFVADLLIHGGWRWLSFQTIFYHVIIESGGLLPKEMSATEQTPRDVYMYDLYVKHPSVSCGWLSSVFFFTSLFGSLLSRIDQWSAKKQTLTRLSASFSVGGFLNFFYQKTGNNKGYALVSKKLYSISNNNTTSVPKNGTCITLYPGFSWHKSLICSLAKNGALVSKNGILVKKKNGGLVSIRCISQCFSRLPPINVQGNGTWFFLGILLSSPIPTWMRGVLWLHLTSKGLKVVSLFICCHEKCNIVHQSDNIKRIFFFYFPSNLLN